MVLLLYDKLNVLCESVVLFGVFDWVKYDLSNWFVNFEELMEYIWFFLMMWKFLMDMVVWEEFIMGSVICWEFVFEVIDYYFIFERRIKNCIFCVILCERLSWLFYVVGGEGEFVSFLVFVGKILCIVSWLCLWICFCL